MWGMLKELGLLVLSRKRNESVCVTVPPSAEPTLIEMVIVEIRGDKVRTGWKAPKQVSVHRSEVQRAIERNGQAERMEA